MFQISAGNRMATGVLHMFLASLVNCYSHGWIKKIILDSSLSSESNDDVEQLFIN